MLFYYDHSSFSWNPDQPWTSNVTVWIYCLSMITSLKERNRKKRHTYPNSQKHVKEVTCMSYVNVLRISLVVRSSMLDCRCQEVAMKEGVARAVIACSCFTAYGLLTLPASKKGQSLHWKISITLQSGRAANQWHWMHTQKDYKPGPIFWCWATHLWLNFVNINIYWGSEESSTLKQKMAAPGINEWMAVLT